MVMIWDSSRSDRCRIEAQSRALPPLAVPVSIINVGLTVKMMSCGMGASGLAWGTPGRRNWD